MGCRNRAYVARGYSQPPSIENFATHPFFREMEAKEAGTSAAPEEASQSAAAQPGAAGKPAMPAATSAPASAPAPPAQLFDLLSLHDVSLSSPKLPTYWRGCLLSIPNLFWGDLCAVLRFPCRHMSPKNSRLFLGDVEQVYKPVRVPHVLPMLSGYRHQQQAPLQQHLRLQRPPTRMKVGLPSWMPRLHQPALRSLSQSRPPPWMTTGMHSRYTCSSACIFYLAPGSIDAGITNFATYWKPVQCVQLAAPAALGLCRSCMKRMLNMF